VSYMLGQRGAECRRNRCRPVDNRLHHPQQGCAESANETCSRRFIR
jgi:hypothetical protein